MHSAIPEGWKKQTLGEVAKVVGGGTPDKSKASYWGGDFHWVTPSEITKLKGRYIDSSVERITADGLRNSSAKLHPPGTVLMTSRASIGLTAINQVPMATNQGFQSFQVEPGCYNEFLYYLISFIREELYSLASGSTFLEISSATVRQLRTVFPPLPEQKKIAAILTSVDEVIEKTEAQIAKLQDLKTAMMQELLTKGIGHTEFKDSPIGRIPASWGALPLYEYLSFISYGFTNPMPEAEEGPYMLTAKDINNGRINFDNARRTSKAAYEELLTDKSRPKRDDILLTKDGTLGRVALVDQEGACINQSVAVLRCNQKILPQFLCYLLQAPQYQQTMLDNAGGSTIKHIYISVVDKMVIGAPPLTEQQGIVDVLDSVCARILKAQLKLTQDNSLKKALMQDLLTGRVRVKV